MKKKFFIEDSCDSRRTGFGIAEVLIASVILGGIAVGITQLINNNLKAQKNVGQVTALSQFETEFQLFLGQRAVCDLNFGPTSGGLEFLPSDVASRQLPTLAVYYPSGTPTALTRGALFAKAGSTSFSGWDLTGLGLRVIGPAGGNAYFVRIEGDFEKQKTGGLITPGASSVKKNLMTMTVVTSAGAAGKRKIDGCGATQPGIVGGGNLDLGVAGSCPAVNRSVDGGGTYCILSTNVTLNEASVVMITSSAHAASWVGSRPRITNLGTGAILQCEATASSTPGAGAQASATCNRSLPPGSYELSAIGNSSATYPYDVTLNYVIHRGSY